MGYWLIFKAIMKYYMRNYIDNRAVEACMITIGQNERKKMRRLAELFSGKIIVNVTICLTTETPGEVCSTSRSIVGISKVPIIPLGEVNNALRKH